MILPLFTRHPFARMAILLTLAAVAHNVVATPRTLDVGLHRL